MKIKTSLISKIIKEEVRKAVNEGTFEGNAIAVYDGENGMTQIYKKGSGYYGVNDDFDFHFETKAELEMMLKKWRYKLVAGALKEDELREAMVDPSNWPIGYFEVKNSFDITPGGGWTVGFKKGMIIQVAQSKVDRSLQTILVWNALAQDWTPKVPPISGYRDNGGMFPIDAFSGSQTWTAKFAQNTTPLSKSQAEAKAKSAAAETVLSAREAVKMLSGLAPNQQVKITIVK